MLGDIVSNFALLVTLKYLYMKKRILIFLLVMTCISSYAITCAPLSLGTTRIAIKRGLYQHQHNYEPIDLPEVIYSSYDSTITVDFGIQPVNNYTVTISSLYADVDYYATSSFTTIPLAVDRFLNKMFGKLE